MALIRCNCNKPASLWQDNKYGKGVRVGTPKQVKQGNPPQFARTVCGTITTSEVK